MHVSLCNLDPKATTEVILSISGIDEIDQVSGHILTAEDMKSHNTFRQPENVKPATFQSFSIAGQTLRAQLAPMSVTVLERGNLLIKKNHS